MSNIMVLARVPSSDERLAAFVAHAGTAFAWFLAPLVVYLLKRNDSKYVAEQALAALLWSILGTIASILTCGLAIPIFLVFHLVAAFKALSGEEFVYPWVGESARKTVYESSTTSAF